MCCFKRSFGILQTKAYKSKTKIKFSNFWYFKKRSIHVPPKNKSTLYLYSICAFFQQNWNALYFVHWWTFSLWAKSGLPDEFSQIFFPITPPGNGNVGLGPRELSEFGFKVGENSPPPKKIAGEISAKNKNNFFGTWVFSTFKLKLQYFVQESAAKFTIFYLL
jgi:hypothetical protein